MAIVVEAEARRTNFVRFFIWLVILGVIIAAVYYIFFKTPELVEVVVPPTFRNTEELSRISLNPESVVQSPTFNALRPYVTPLVPPPPGRPNPFLAF